MRRGPFYTAWHLNEKDLTTLNIIDVAEHAVRRKILGGGGASRTSRCSRRRAYRWEYRPLE